jgi:TonB family protein
MTTLRPALVAFAILVLTALSARAGDLGRAQVLYADAAYEEALAALGPPGLGDETVIEPNQLRALCLLALGRTIEAESAVERIVRHDPAYAVPVADVSPKLVTLFKDVRRRTLAAMAREAYAAGKAHLDAAQWSSARTEFTRMTELLAHPELANQPDAALDELRELGAGFLALSDMRLAAAPAPSPTSRAPDAQPRGRTPGPIGPPASAGGVPSPARQAAASPSAATDDGDSADPSEASVDVRVGTPVFSALDQDVTPPVELLRRMPRWAPSGRAQSRETYRGMLDIVIDERGRVESASIARSVTPTYDEALVEAALAWRFSPARKDGQPVRYRQVLEIVLRPTGSR